MNTMIQLFLFALTAGVLYPLIKSYTPQLASPFAAAVCIGLVRLMADAGETLFQWVIQLGESLDGEAFLCLIKASGIALCTDWCCDLCKDGGLSAAAGSIELCGRILILAAAFPLFRCAYTTLLGLV